MTGWNLPPGITVADIDRAAGSDDEPCPHGYAPNEFCVDCDERPGSDDEEPPEPDGEAFRGHEAAGYLAEQQDYVQRNLKR